VKPSSSTCTTASSVPSIGSSSPGSHNARSLLTNGVSSSSVRGVGTGELRQPIAQRNSTPLSKVDVQTEGQRIITAPPGICCQTISTTIRCGPV
jgi:hypothetical protein